MGIIINHYKDPLLNKQDSMECKGKGPRFFFFRGSFQALEYDPPQQRGARKQQCGDFGALIAGSTIPYGSKDPLL